MFTLADHRLQQNENQGVQAITQSTAKNLRRLRFGNSVVLLGHQVVPKAGGLELQLAWEKTGAIDHGRFVHICDENGKIVGHGPREEKKFHQAKVGTRFVESVFLIDLHGSS